MYPCRSQACPSAARINAPRYTTSSQPWRSYYTARPPRLYSSAPRSFPASRGPSPLAFYRASKLTEWNHRASPLFRRHLHQNEAVRSPNSAPDENGHKGPNSAHADEDILITEESHHGQERYQRLFVIRPSEPAGKSSADQPQGYPSAPLIDSLYAPLPTPPVVHDQQLPSSATLARKSILARFRASVVNHLVNLFLPANYPESVISDYPNYYKWIFVQNILGSISYVMSMEALLHAVGVSSNATGWAAGASWVLKDGLGAVGLIFFAKFVGEASWFDAKTLRAKWLADFAFNAGVFVELLTLSLPMFFLLLASIANVLKGAAGMMNAATRATINRLLAKQSNMGDVTAKSQSQGLAAYLIGCLLGIVFGWTIPYISNAVAFVQQTFLSMEPVGCSRPSILFFAFSVLTVLYIYSGYKALRSLALRSLNEDRSAILMDWYFHGSLESKTPTWAKDLPPPAPGRKIIVPTPQMIKNAKIESILLPHPLLVGDTIRVRLGSDLPHAFASQAELAKRIHAAGTDKYLVNVRNSKSAHSNAMDEIVVVLHKEAKGVDQLRAFFHVSYLQRLILKKCRPVYAEKYFDEPLNANSVVWGRALKFRRPSFSLPAGEDWDELLDDSWRYTYSNFDIFFSALNSAEWRTTDIILRGPAKTVVSWTFQAHSPKSSTSTSSSVSTTK